MSSLCACKTKKSSEEFKFAEVPQDAPPEFKAYIDQFGPEKFTKFMNNLGYQSIEAHGQPRWGNKYGRELPLAAVNKDYSDFLKVEFEKFNKNKAAKHS